LPRPTTYARERAQALDLALERLRSGFDSVAGDALRSNSELFLQIAREMLGQQQQLALAQPHGPGEVRGGYARARSGRAAEGRTGRSRASRRSAAESFGALRSSIEGVVLGQAALQRETRNQVTGFRRPEVRGRWGEMTCAVSPRSRDGRTLRLREQVHVAGEERSLRPDMNREHARRPPARGESEDPARCLLSAIEAGPEEERAYRVSAIHAHASSSG
jgi:hypothetical protein